jgi:hypothetical protein
MPAMIGGRLARWSPWTLDAGADQLAVVCVVLSRRPDNETAGSGGIGQKIGQPGQAASAVGEQLVRLRHAESGRHGLEPRSEFPNGSLSGTAVWIAGNDGASVIDDGERAPGEANNSKRGEDHGNRDREDRVRRTRRWR